MSDPFILRCGKYKGTSLEEVALGKGCPGGKSEGYYYFNQLATGEAKYFGWFWNSMSARRRWNEVHTRLNNFVSAKNCVTCGQVPATVISVAGSGRYGYSVGSCYVACDKEDCQRSLTRMPSCGTMLLPIGFDTILQFGWSAGDRKYDEKKITKLMLELAGWTQGRMTAQNATDFIDSRTLKA